MIQPSDVILFVAMLVALFVFIILNRMGIDEKIAKKLERTKVGLEDGVKSSSPKNASDAKKHKFIEMHSIIPHYINKKKVEQFYSEQFGQNFHLESIVDETTNEIQGSAGSNVAGGAVAISTDGKNIHKQTSNFQAKNDDVLLSSMFLKFQKATVEKNLVTLGLEEIEYPSFQNMGDEANSKNADAASRLGQQIIKQVLKNLEKAGRLVLVEGYFDITKDGENYKYLYKHPVNSFISNQSEHITFSFIVPAGDLEKEVRSADCYQQDNATIKIAVFGYVLQHINSEKGIWNLQLIPIAVY